MDQSPDPVGDLDEDAERDQLDDPSVQFLPHRSAAGQCSEGVRLRRPQGAPHSTCHSNTKPLSAPELLQGHAHPQSAPALARYGAPAADGRQGLVRIDDCPPGLTCPAPSRRTTRLRLPRTPIAGHSAQPPATASLRATAPRPPAEPTPPAVHTHHPEPPMLEHTRPDTQGSAEHTRDPRTDRFRVQTCGDAGGPWGNPFSHGLRGTRYGRALSDWPFSSDWPVRAGSAGVGTSGRARSTGVGSVGARCRGEACPAAPLTGPGGKVT